MRIIVCDDDSRISAVLAEKAGKFLPDILRGGMMPWKPGQYPCFSIFLPP